VDANAGRKRTRRAALKTLSGMGLALVGHHSLLLFADEPGVDPRVEKIVRDTISVDMHNHSAQPSFAQISQLPKQFPLVDLKGQMLKSGLTAICLTYAIDSDRSPKPGDWYQYHLQCLSYIDRTLEQNGMRRAVTLADLKAAHKSGTPIVIQDCEGSQWIEGHLERVEEAYTRGLRHMQLLHQMRSLVSSVGGVQQLIQPKGGDQSINSVGVTGLTPFGAEVIRECNRLGIVVDLAHATEATVLAALKVAQRPLVVTHTALDKSLSRSDRMYIGDPGLTARLVSTNYVKAVAGAGGIVGVWHIFPTLKDYVTGLKQMADVAGVDHTGIGTDTSIAPLPSRRGGGTNALWPDQNTGFLYAVVSEMLTQGFHPEEISKIVGGNYCRVFSKVTEGNA
jgi:membrane dipeptidase